MNVFQHSKYLKLIFEKRILIINLCVLSFNHSFWYSFFFFFHIYFSLFLSTYLLSTTLAEIFHYSASWLNLALADLNICRIEFRGASMLTYGNHDHCRLLCKRDCASYNNFWHRILPPSLSIFFVRCNYNPQNNVTVLSTWFYNDRNQFYCQSSFIKKNVLVEGQLEQLAPRGPNSTKWPKISWIVCSSKQKN